MGTPAAVVEHYADMQRLASKAVLRARRYWRLVNPADLSGSWLANLAALEAFVSAVQSEAATAGAGYSATALAQQGLYEAPAAFVDPSAFAGVAADGRPLQGLLYAAVPYTKRLIGSGVEPGTALANGSRFLDKVVKTTVADAARGAASVDIASRPRTGYTRMLNHPSCPRCVILAGKFFRWNKGFQRHPGCDCRHIPTTESVAEDVTTDPYAYFNSLPEAEQDRLFGSGSARAIRDGADIFQVVNAERGMKPSGLVTTEGTSRRGNFGNARGQRVTPDAIYARGLSRDETFRELERYGYVLPGGQNRNGVIRGSGVGFASRQTMTAAEKRASDAKANWDAVREGRNPFGRGALTPQLQSAVENDFRRIIVNGDAAAKITARRSMGG